jgi:hypothetical protein
MDASMVGQQPPPAQLAAGDIYSMLTINAGISNWTTLVIDSPTNGALVVPDGPPAGGIFPVSIQYALLTPLSGQLQVVIPASTVFPMPQTNLYYLAYTSATEGSCQVTNLIGGNASYGQFVRDRSFAGQQVASSSLTAGEIYTLVAVSAGISNVNTLVINSPTNGALVSSWSITPVTLQYSLLGPLSCQLQIGIPAGNGYPVPQTNVCYVVYTSTNSGSCQLSTLGGSVYSLGQFVRDRSLVGQQIASTQLTAGETYSLVTTNPNAPLAYWSATLMINSPTSAVGIFGGATQTGVFPVSIQYALLGPLCCQMQVVTQDAYPVTNLYYLVYTHTNSGPSQNVQLMTYTFGQFARDRSGVGEQQAPAQLAAGEVYSFLTTNAGFASQSTLVISSPTTGLLLLPGTPPMGGIIPVSLSYSVLGPMCCRLEAVVPADIMAPFPVTNVFYLAYTSSGSGPCQAEMPMPIARSGSGQFVRDASLVGQQLASAQLTPGESYSLLTTNLGIPYAATLVINSPTNGILMVSGIAPPGGIFQVSLQYSYLGPLAGQLQVVYTDASPQTNVYTLVYTSTNSGPCQAYLNGNYGLGQFTRDRSLVGQQRAPIQLTAGEIYSLLATNAGISSQSTLIINSPTTGMLTLPGIPPMGGICPVSLQYSLLGPLSCQLQATIPAGIVAPTPAVYVYTLVFTYLNTGGYQLTYLSGPIGGGGLGQFGRDSSLVGRQMASPELAMGEVYSLLATNGGTSNLTTLVINSTTSGALVTSGPPPIGGITLASLQYAYLGPLSCQFQVIIPASNVTPLPQTNLYNLVYDSTNAGAFEVWSSGAGTYSTGQFTRDRSLVGQQWAPAQLTAGESYTMTISSVPLAMVDTVIVGSSTNGIFVRQGSTGADGIYPGTALQYLALGNIMAQLQTVIQQSQPMPMLLTNTYLLLYSAPNTGQFQRASDPAMLLLGQFRRSPPQ